MSTTLDETTTSDSGGEDTLEEVEKGISKIQIDADAWKPQVTLHPTIKKKVKALKKLQLKSTEIEAKFFEEVHLLECKYQEKYSPLYERRESIVSGTYEPNDEECDFKEDEDEEEEESGTASAPPRVESSALSLTPAPSPTGIPDFWLTVFKNATNICDMVKPHDEPILKKLTDVKVLFIPCSPMGYALEFHFAPNEFFSNSVLSKEYELKCEPDESDPFDFEGPEICKCKGTTIDWNKGKNVTVRTIEKKQKHKSKGSVRTVIKTVQNESFFNFFSPPRIPEDRQEDLDDDTRALLTSDFEIGHYIKERVVPRAVLYFTGEAVDEDEDDFDEDDDEEDDEHEVETDERGEGARP